MSPLTGQVVLVTGAGGSGGSGLGATLAAVLAGRGAHVIATDIDAARAASTAAAARDAGGAASALPLDVRDETSWAAVRAAVLAEHGKLDALVNNAGVAAFDGDMFDLEAFDRVMAVNARGVFLGMRAFVPEMAKRGSGVVVNIGSAAAHVGLPDMHMAYGATKAAIQQMTRAAAVQFGPRGVRVVSVAPAMLTRRPMPDAGATEDRAGKVPLRRFGRAEDVARVVAFALSADASHVTGTELVVDGGYLAAR